MPYQPPLRERVVAQCEHQMEVQGYVRFTDIATAENVTRSRIGQGLNEAVTHKLISDEQAKAWSSSYQHNTRPWEFRISKRNYQQILDIGEALNLSPHDVVNRVLVHSLSTFTQAHESSSDRQT